MSFSPTSFWTLKNLPPGKPFSPNLEAAIPGRMTHCDYLRGQSELKYTEVVKMLDTWSHWSFGSMSEFCLLVWVLFFCLFVCEFCFVLVGWLIGVNVPCNSWDRLVLKKFKFPLDMAFSVLNGNSAAVHFYVSCM